MHYVPYVPCPEACKISHDEECHLIRRALDGDSLAISQLLQMHHPCIERLARKFPYSNSGIEDLCQEGMIAFNYKTWSRNYDPSRQVRLWTYARPVVWQHMSHECRRAHKHAEETSSIYDVEDGANEHDPTPAISGSDLFGGGQDIDFTFEEVLECLTAKDGPRWIVLFLLQDNEYAWGAIAEALKHCSEDVAGWWPAACAAYGVPPAVPRSWKAVCELFSPVQPTELALKQWYSRQRRNKLQHFLEDKRLHGI